MSKDQRPPGGSSPERPADAHDEFEPLSIAAGGLEVLLARFGVLLSQMVMILLTGRFMGPSGRGLYALASLSIGLCQAPFGSVWVANAVELAKRRATPTSRSACRSLSRSRQTG